MHLDQCSNWQLKLRCFSPNPHSTLTYHFQKTTHLLRYHYKKSLSDSMKVRKQKSERKELVNLRRFHIFASKKGRLWQVITEGKIHLQTGPLIEELHPSLIIIIIEPQHHAFILGRSSDGRQYNGSKIWRGNTTIVCCVRSDRQSQRRFFWRGLKSIASMNLGDDPCCYNCVRTEDCCKIWSEREWSGVSLFEWHL